MLVAAFLAIWIPYEAAVGLQERFHVPGPWGPLLMALSLVIACAVAAWLRRRSGPDPFGLRLDRWTVPLVLAGIGIMVIARFLAAAIAIKAGFAATDASAGPVAASFAMALVIGAVPALSEDILTRGFPLFAARSARPALLLIIVSAAMYMLNHIWRFDWGPSEQLRLFCMGIAYAAAAWRFRSLWAAFGLHLGWNAGSALVPLDIGATDAFRLESAVMHLVIAVLVLLVPGRRRDN